MDSVDLEVLRKSAQWLDSGQRVLLVTVVKTWGSSPRPPGAMLAVREDGIVVGSVSGGCIEDDIVERSRRVQVSALDHRGDPITIDASGWYARILQHEIDHLNGILFIQHLSMLKRDLIKRKIKKLRKLGEW